MTREDFIENVSKLTDSFKENAKHVEQFMLEAFDNHAEIKDMSHVIVPIESLRDINSKYYGLFISIYREFMAVWIAIDDGHGVRDGMSIGDYPLDLSFSELVNKCKNDLDICPKCKRKVGLANMKQFSFAGRCCEKCLPEMRKEYEQPGWYN